nr:protein KASH5 isoform X2 [Pogona vitticeps]
MMEDIYQKSPENAVFAQLTAVLSTEIPWDNSVISSKNIILNTSQCSEEHVLKCTFKACDPEQTGEVSVFRIIEYLQEMTGESCEDWRFRSLYKRLDPEERGVTVDFSTFYAVMKDWIADCRHEGQREEATELTNSIHDLQQGNKKLARQNIKLQKTIEAAEELNSRLSEEMTELNGKLRSVYYSTQQALEQAKVMANELEDLKIFSKNLEEETNKLHTQVRQMEKEQQLLSVQVDNLQEENKKLLQEKESTKYKIKELFTKKAKIKFQLSEYENLLSCKDAALNKKTKEIEDLRMTLDEYRMVIEELKLEVSRHQDHQDQYYQDLDMLSRDSLQSVKACLQVPAQPLCTEIEESQKEFSEGADLPSPLCGMLPSLMTRPVTAEELRSLAEEQEMGRSGTEYPRALLQRTHSLPHLLFRTDAKQILRGQECNQQQQHLPSEVGGRSSEVALLEQALVPVHGELTPATGKTLNDSFFEILLRRFLDVPLGFLLLHIMQKWVFPGLLLACISLLIMGYLVLPFNQHPVWIEPNGNPWPQLHLQYLRPPPI